MTAAPFLGADCNRRDRQAMADQDVNLPLQYAAQADYAPLSQHRKLAKEVVGIREDQVQVASQNAFRGEMSFVQAMSDYRRARWWSLAAYIMCAMASMATLVFTIQPALHRRWRAVVIALAMQGIWLVVLGLRRDGQYAKNRWTRLRFQGPRNIE